MKLLSLIFLTLLSTTVFAQDPILLNDFTTSGASTFDFDPEIEGITTDNQFYFAADDGIHGKELWRSNGTAVGTQLLKDINPNEANSNIRLLTAIGNTVYFVASTPEFGFELWTTQGTTSSTQMVTDLNPGPQSGFSNLRYAVLNDVLYFVGNGDKGRELYRSEGTEASTVLVKDISPNVTGSGLPFSSNLQNFTVAQDIIYFTANDGENGQELWRTDGTSAGTVMIVDITDGAGSTNFGRFKAVGNTLIFTADDGVHGTELWATTGSLLTTGMLKDITEGEEGSVIEILELVNNVLYFTVKESVFRNLWKSNGTEAGTQPVLDGDGNNIRVRGHTMYQDQLFFRGNNKLWKADGTTEELAVDQFIGSEDFAILNDSLYFIANESGGGNGIWKTDGTTEGTSLMKEITSASYQDITHLTAGNNRLFFIAETDEFGGELWTSDGTEAGTFMLIDSKPGEEDGFRSYEDVSFHFLGDQLFFAGFSEAEGRELWKTDGTTAGTTLVKDINTQSEDIRLYSNPVAYQNQTYFATDEGVWKTDGTSEGTTLLQESFSAFGLNVLGEQLIYNAPASSSSRTLWSSNGTEEGTQPLLDSAASAGLTFIFRDNQPQIGNSLFFGGRQTEFGYELWKTEGTAEGTSMVRDINEGNGDSFYSFENDDFIITSDILYFPAADETLGQELWKTDGTEVGTVPVSDINPFGSAAPRSFAEIDGTIYFTAEDGTAGRELWKTDGTTNGTVLVKDIYVGDEGDDGLSSNAELINYQGNLFFTASDGVNGRELWKSDGTEAGTQMVKDIYPKSSNSNTIRNGSPSNLIVYNDLLLFVAQDSTGYKIWRSDGTEAGTQPYIDMETGGGLIDVNGTLFFAGIDDEHGRELWRTDGTPEGTRMVQDIFAGPNDSSPRPLGYINDALYFTALDETNGRELWTLSPLRIQTELSTSSSAVCSTEDSIAFTISATDAGAEPTYQWYVNNQLIPDQSGSTYTAAEFTDGDEVKVQVIASKDVWVLQDSVFSETFTVDLSALIPKITVANNTLTASEGASYQWFLDGTPLPETTQTITALESGNYQVEITSASGCTTRSEEVEVIVCTSNMPSIQVEGSTLTASEASSYRWFRDGEALPDTTQSIEVEEAGSYEVEVTDGSGCVARSEAIEVEGMVTGLIDERLAEGLTMYPNPATSHLLINSPLGEEIEVAIYSTTGQLKHQSILSSRNSDYEIELGGLSPGLYLVRFTSNQGWHQRKLIKQ